MFPEVPDNNEQQKVMFNATLILFGEHCTRRNLCNVVREATDSIVKENVMCNFILIPLGRHCTGRNPIQCCPRSFRQNCIRKNLVPNCLNTLETTLQRSKPGAMLCDRFQTTLYKKKCDAMFS